MSKITGALALIVASAVAHGAAAQVSPPPETAPAAAASAPATVAAVSAAAVPAPPACELHIWPAAEVGAVTQGAGAGFGLIGALADISAHADQNKRDKAFITAALDSSAQAKSLRELSLPTLLHLPPVSVIQHDQGVRITSDNPQRLANSSAPCYYDFVVRELFYMKTALSHGKMRTYFAVRGYDGTKLTVDYKGSQNHVLDVKLPNENEDAGPASDALINAFKADVNEFAEKFVSKTAKN